MTLKKLQDKKILETAKEKNKLKSQIKINAVSQENMINALKEKLREKEEEITNLILEKRKKSIKCVKVDLNQQKKSCPEVDLKKDLIKSKEFKDSIL